MDRDHVYTRIYTVLHKLIPVLELHILLHHEQEEYTVLVFEEKRRPRNALQGVAREMQCSLGTS